MNPINLTDHFLKDILVLVGGRCLLLQYFRCPFDSRDWIFDFLVKDFRTQFSDGSEMTRPQQLLFMKVLLIFSSDCRIFFGHTN